MASVESPVARAAPPAADDETEELRRLAAGAAVGLTRCGRDLRYRSANPAYARLVGLPVERIVGRPIAEVLGPAALELMRPHIERVLEGEPVQHEVELPLAAAGKRFVEVAYMPDFDADGRIDGWVASVSEITGRKHAEQVVLEQQRLLAALSESVPDAIMIVSPEGRMLHHNQRFLDLWQFPREVVESGSDERALQWAAGRTEDPAAFLAGVAAVYAQQDEPVRQELRLKDGRVYERCGAPVGEGAARLGWVWTFRDISERQRAEAALRRRNRQLDLLAVCSHALVIGGHDEPALLQSVFEKMAGLLGTELMYSFLVADEPRVLRRVAQAGLTPRQAEAYATVRFGEHLCGTVAERQQRIVADDLAHCEFADEARALREDGVQCYAGFPLLAAGRLLGTVAFASRSRRRFEEEELQTIQAVCDQVGAMLERTRLFEHLRASEERLTAFFASASVGAALLTLDACFLRVNQSFCRITGYSAEELAAMDCAALTHPDDLGPMRSAIAALVADRVPTVTLEKRYRRKDGTLVWVHNSVSLTRDAAGRPLHLVAVCEDVSERKRSETLLVEQRDVLECVAAGEPLEKCLRRLTAAMPRLQAGTRAAVVLADASRSRFAGFHSSGIAASFGEALLGRAIGAAAAGTCSIAIHGGTAATCADTERDERWSPLWRRLCAAHGIRACHSEPVTDAAGRAIASFMLCFDEAHEPGDWERRIAVFGAHVAGIVLERDRHVGALREHADRLQRSQHEALARSAQVRRLADVATRLAQLHDPREIMDMVNEAARELIGAHQGVSSMTVDADWAQAIVAVSLSDKYARWRHYAVPPSGAGIYSLVCSSNRPMRLTQDELLAHPAWKGFGAHAAGHPPMRGWLAAPLTGLRDGNLGLIQLSDKTEGEFSADDEAVLVQLAQMASVALDNARLVAELREADRRKDEFLATLAHELRNPLAPLRNGLQVMKLAPDHAEAVARSREVMERQLGVMVRLIDDLLDLSRISRGRIDLRCERVELARVVQQAVETSRPQVEAGGHELSFELPAQRLFVDADVTRLAQVIANLLNNAAKYTEPGGRIRLGVAREGADAVVSVRDSGVGIAAHMLPVVFEMFTQLDRRPERAQGGLGIGLSLVKVLVELHGGSVEARSEGEGRGSEFVIRLPAAPDAAVPAPPPRGDARPAAGRRILVVDDNRDAASSLATMLGLMGNETQTAHDGGEALDMAAAFRPEVMLLDIGMPRLSGYEVCRTLRRQPWGAGITVVALTGWGQEEDRRRSREAGFDGHLVKPVDLAALSELLARR